MKRTEWEYHVEYIQTNLQSTLDRLGANGWELVSEEKCRFVFKRPAGSTS